MNTSNQQAKTMNDHTNTATSGIFATPEGTWLKYYKPAQCKSHFLQLMTEGLKSGCISVTQDGMVTVRLSEDRVLSCALSNPDETKTLLEEASAALLQVLNATMAEESQVVLKEMTTQESKDIVSCQWLAVPTQEVINAMADPDVFSVSVIRSMVMVRRTVSGKLTKSVRRFNVEGMVASEWVKRHCPVSYLVYAESGH